MSVIPVTGVKRLENGEFVANLSGSTTLGGEVEKGREKGEEEENDKKRRKKGRRGGRRYEEEENKEEEGRRRKRRQRTEERKARGEMNY